MKKIITLLLFNISIIFAQDKIAFVVGNGNYTDAPLRNTINDARDISNKFSEIGYEVTTLINGNREEIETTLYKISSSLPIDSQVVFYYAGHAVQIDGSNYLIPVGERITSESSIKYKGVNLDYILEELNSSPSRTNIVILDSCRDNPYSDSTRGNGTRGLKIINRTPPSGDQVKNSVVIYATAEGKTADDGDGRNSPFTQAFLRHMTRDGETIQDVMTYVSRDVLEISDGEQFPQISNSSIEKIYLVSGKTSIVQPREEALTGNGTLIIDVMDSGTLYFDGDRVNDIQANSSITIRDVEPGNYIIRYITEEGSSNIEAEVISGEDVYVVIPSLGSGSENDKILQSLRLEKEIVEESIEREEEKLSDLKRDLFTHLDRRDYRESKQRSANRTFLVSVASFIGAGISGYYLYENYQAYENAYDSTIKEEYKDDTERMAFLTGGLAVVGLVSSGVSNNYRQKVQEYDFNRDIIEKTIKDQEAIISRLKSKRQNISLKIQKYSR